ncbi:LacI family DNA-binding transcriptional regulator [Aestuariimicrobium kwangyangense]|uniref:LacI family DNA-binding transcriptional regulator n=1 Tax=Aestuariimicrobium kwangyangense TaxID=396389 RepID=UPI0003B58AB4|nr:LacI family DNA-binding transcriptional regulator [Aestuariimicrobium kwangyangense]
MTTSAGRATLKQVAERAGVSLATASRAINGSGTRQVNPELAERVLQAAAELDYVVNVQAQAMARGRTNVLGLVVADIVDPYFATIASGVIAEASASSCLVNLAITDRLPEREQEFLRMFGAQQVRGVVLAGSRAIDASLNEALIEQVQAVEASGGRVVSLGQSMLGGDAVVIANREGAADLAAALLNLGHRRFGILAGPENLHTPVDRTQGFVDTVVAAGAPAPVVVHSAFSRDGGSSAMETLLAEHGPGSATSDPVTCVFAAADALAVGALTACREAGVGVPDQISLAGFDDVPTLRDIHPHLSTVALPMFEAGRAAAALALQPSIGAPRTVPITGRVVLRQSTRTLVRD